MNFNNILNKSGLKLQVFEFTNRERLETFAGQGMYFRRCLLSNGNLTCVDDKILIPKLMSEYRDLHKKGVKNRFKYRQPEAFTSKRYDSFISTGSSHF